MASLRLDFFLFGEARSFNIIIIITISLLALHGLEEKNIWIVAGIEPRSVSTTSRSSIHYTTDSRAPFYHCALVVLEVNTGIPEGNLLLGGGFLSLVCFSTQQTSSPTVKGSPRRLLVVCQVMNFRNLLNWTEEKQNDHVGNHSLISGLVVNPLGLKDLVSNPGLVAPQVISRRGTGRPFSCNCQAKLPD